MVEGAVNALGKIGDGQVFDEVLFEKAYKSFDKWNTQKIIKQMVLGMITYMVQNKDK